MADLVAALERAFAAGPGDSRVLGLDAPGGTFHVKVATHAAPATPGGDSRPVFVAKVNANFPGNPAAGLPTIQGVAALFDARDGTLLALLDSPELTARRTGAATAVAARRMARAGARSLLLCGCGRQAAAQLEAVSTVLGIDRLTVCDLDSARAERFAGEATLRYGLAVAVARHPSETSREHDLIVTCTSARGPILGRADVAPGTFLAAVGADHPTKQELDPALVAAARLVVDARASAAASGELHHALEAGFAGLAERAAELGEVVRGERPGRANAEEITLFDSTGIALEDAAAALVAYERARRSGAPVCDFGS